MGTYTVVCGFSPSSTSLFSHAHITTRQREDDFFSEGGGRRDTTRVTLNQLPGLAELGNWLLTGDSETTNPQPVTYQAVLKLLVAVSETPLLLVNPSLARGGVRGAGERREKICMKL